MNKHLNRIQAAYDKPSTKVVIGLVMFVVGVLVIHGGDALPYLFGAVVGVAASLAYLTFGGAGSKQAEANKMDEDTGGMGAAYRGHTAGGGIPMLDNDNDD